MKIEMMGIENHPQEKNKEEILGSNLGSLCDIFISNKKIGDYSSTQEQAEIIAAIIKEHLDEQNKRINDPHAFLNKIHNARESALAGVQDSKKEEIRELFKHVDMPDLELSEKE